MRNSIALLLTAVLSVASYKIMASESLVKYPDNFRDWKHIKSMVITEGHPLENPFKGIHHVYGNAAAVKGLKSGNYSNGSVLVFDLWNYKNSDSTYQESDRKLVGVMEYDSKKFAKTGGWGFEGFAGSSTSKRLTSDGGVSCYNCHTSQKNKSYVFSELRN